jgi:hypothetical protein
MTSYKNYCHKSAKKIDDFLAENPELGPEHLQVLKKLNIDLEEQFKRMEISWFSKMDDIADAPTHATLEKMFNDVDDYVTKTLGVSQKAILGRSPSTNAGAASGHVKIDDTLKPRQALIRSFTLEEANIWFDGFTAYYNHNEKVLEKLTPLMRRQLLNNVIEVGLASALQTDDDVTMATPILGVNGCLTRLKNIFLEKNPLFLRHYRFQQCSQTQGVTVPEFLDPEKGQSKGM